MNYPPWGWRSRGGFQPSSNSGSAVWEPHTSTMRACCECIGMGCSMCPSPAASLHSHYWHGSCSPPSNGPTTATAPQTTGSNGPVPGTQLDDGLRAGIQYLFADTHTYIQVPRPTVKLWEERHVNFDFEIFKVPCSVTTQQLMISLGGDKDSTLVECVEKGNGVFVKGITLKYSDKAAEKSIESRGWTPKRGREQAPVWLVLLDKE